MTYEKEIPAYALQPAKAPRTVEPEAIFHTAKINYPCEIQRTTFQVEEDILVPDTKADMKEILMMEAACDLSPEEKSIVAKSDELLNFTGMIELQTLYNPEGDTKKPVSITSKVPYRFQWNLAPEEDGEGLFCISVKTLEYMMINERKFRVKLSLELTGQLFCRKEFSFFDGLKGDQLEMKTSSVSMCGLTAVKKDEISIDENFSPRESGISLREILKQTFLVVENYRQITTEKIVINGFIFINLLCEGIKEDGGETVLYQHHEKVEFTQFLPIEKELRKKTWCAAKVSFASKDLKVDLVQRDDNPQETGFQIKGAVAARVELYESRTEKTVMDAYHREKTFDCSFNSQPVLESLDQSVTEVTIRELLHLPEGKKAEEVVCCTGRATDCSLKTERGKLIAAGDLEFSCLWRSQQGTYHNTKMRHHFQQPLEMEKAQEYTGGICTAQTKQSWAVLINERQIEVTCTAALCTELRKENLLKMLESPVFLQEQKTESYPMAVVTVKEDETLWDLAKKYRTTESQIRKMNRLEKEPAEGQKLLIAK